MQRGADVPFLLMGFPWYFPGYSFEVCQSALMSLVTFVALRLYYAGKTIHFVCEFVCVSLRPIMIHLLVLELLVQI